jgi:hypothetical protein
MYRPDWFGNVPHARWFAWTIGILAGAATMLANAAGPVFAIYLIAVGLPKMEFVGTSAWFFFIINLFKVPFSIALDASTSVLPAGDEGGGGAHRLEPRAGSSAP